MLFLSDLSSQFYDFFFNYHYFFNNVDMMLKKDKYYIRSLHSMTFCSFISGTLITLKSVKKKFKNLTKRYFYSCTGK